MSYGLSCKQTRKEHDAAKQPKTHNLLFAWYMFYKLVSPCFLLEVVVFMVEARTFLDRFMKVYSGLPLEERKLPVVVIGSEPISWNMAYAEIKENTKLGLQVAEKMVELKII